LLVEKTKDVERAWRNTKSAKNVPRPLKKVLAELQEGGLVKVEKKEDEEDVEMEMKKEVREDDGQGALLNSFNFDGQ